MNIVIGKVKKFVGSKIFVSLFNFSNSPENSEEILYQAKLLRDENEFNTYYVDDIVYCLVVNINLSEIYILGKKITDINENIDLGKINEVPALGEINETTFDKYLKVIQTSNQIIIINEKDGYALIGNKNTGAIIIVNDKSISMKYDKSELNIKKDSIEINSDYIFISGKKAITLASTSIGIGKGAGYVVTSPAPGVSSIANGMVLNSSLDVKS